LTFKDLKKRAVSETAQQQQQSRLSQRLHDKPFWIWNIDEHRREDVKTNGDCCFNHIIGLPQKDSFDKPLYDYQRMIYDSLVAHNGNKHLWIKKATGLGISEFMLRFMAWLCLKDNALSGSQMCIVTGPRIDLAITLIDRMKKLFANSKGGAAIAFDTKELSTVYGLMSKYQVDSVYVDGANPSFIRSLKLQIGEDPEYDKVIARYKSEGLDENWWTKDMRIIPVNFGKEHKPMLGHCKMILEKDGGRIAINPAFDKLITSLRD
jgi:hypothetical protein